MSGFLFQISEKGTDVGTPLITLDANTLDEALKQLVRNPISFSCWSVRKGKYYLSNPWTSWYVELAYRDAKIIKIEE